MAVVGGPDGQITWTTGGSGPDVTEVTKWTLQTQNIVRKNTPVGWKSDRFYVGRTSARLRLWIEATDTDIAPLPGNVSGSVVLTSSTGENYTGNFSALAMVHQYDNPGDFQGHVYDAILNATTSTDEITDTHV